MIENGQVYGGPEVEIPQGLSFGEHVVKKLKENGDKIALVNGKTGEQSSYMQLLVRIERIGMGLSRMGLCPGDVVAVCSENCSEHIAATVAASTVGLTVTLINVKYTLDEMLHAFKISKPKLVFCSEATLETILNTLLLVSCVEHIVQLNGEVGVRDVVPLASLEESLRCVEMCTSERVCVAEDTAFIFYSSGTTGLPKGVMLTHQNIIYGTTVYNNANNDKENVLTVLPWYHVYGLLTTIQYLISGNLVVYLPELVHDKYLDTIEKYQISEMSTVPPMVHILAKSPLVEKYDLSSVRRLWCAAAPLSADVISSALKNLPNCEGIFQAYGMTETTLAILKEQNNCNGTRKRGSCGVPLPGFIAKIVDVVSREKLGPNEQGELCIKGPTMMKGYVDNETATRAMYDHDGFIKTGDIGYYENDGCFYIVDRLKELIKYKGQQVAPALVESVIMEHEGVAECGVVGAPHECAGELPTAFVVRKPGASLTEQELLHFTSARLSSFSRLRGGVIFVEEIPKNGSGKILRRELRNKLMEINGLK